MTSERRVRDDGTASERRVRGGEPTDGGVRNTPEREGNGVSPGPSGAETVTFESENVRCEADLYLPGSSDPPWPIVVMAHVFGAERSWGLALFAERFTRAGLAALAFDYRHLGGSDGTPRRLVDPRRQLADWTAAVTYVRSLEVVDEDRVALWGTSFSGGNALACATQNSEARAVVAQVPLVDGRAAVAHQVRDRSARSRVRTGGYAIADRALGIAGLGSIEIPLVTEPGGGGLVDSPGAASGFSALVPEGVELVNRTPARVVLDLPGYRPVCRADEIDVPVHVVVATEDRLLPPGPTERALDLLSDPSVHRVPAGHFDVHRDPWFGPVADEQVAFLSEALAVDD